MFTITDSVFHCCRRAWIILFLYNWFGESCLQQKEEAIEFSGEGVAFWVGAAVAFGAGIWYTLGGSKAEEYFAGYLLEQSLSVDNLFVFILVFDFFKTPEDSQLKVLNYGIITAGVLRLIMILIGVELIDNFKPILLFFAGLLIYSCYKLLITDKDTEEVGKCKV